MCHIDDSIVKALIEKCPVSEPNDGLGATECAYCGENQGFDWDARKYLGWSDPKSHRPDCPWLRLLEAW